MRRRSVLVVSIVSAIPSATVPKAPRPAAGNLSAAMTTRIRELLLVDTPAGKDLCARVATEKRRKVKEGETKNYDPKVTEIAGK